MQLVQLLLLHSGCDRLWWNSARAPSRNRLRASEAVVPMAVAGSVLEAVAGSVLEAAQAYARAEEAKSVQLMHLMQLVQLVDLEVVQLVQLVQPSPSPQVDRLGPALAD